MADRAGPGGGALGRLRGSAHVMDRLERRIGAHIHKILRAVHAADPIEFRVIEPHLFAAGELIEINPRYDRRDRQTVGFGHAVEMVGGDQRAGPRHILHDEVGVSRNMLAPMLGYEARMSIILASRGGPGNEGNRLALIERCLGVKAGAPCQEKENA